MKITIIGASAGVGIEATRLALAQGHEVSTLSRRVDTLPDHPKLRKVQGSSKNLQDVKVALEGAEAILVALGTGSSTKPTTLYSDSARILLQALRENGTNVPLIVLTGFGAGESWGYNSFLIRFLFGLFLKAVYADKSEMERMISAGYARWVMVRPGRLTNGEMTGRYRILDKLITGMKVGAISRADVAHFMVAQAVNPSCIGLYPALTN